MLALRILNIRRWWLMILGINLSVILAYAQSEPIYFKNPSFEREDYYALSSGAGPSWRDCGFFKEEPVALQPGQHEVRLRPHHLRHYFSMVVRDNNTWDAIGQELTRPLQPGQCYRFTLYLAKSDNYQTLSRTNGQKTNYRNPLRLIVWGGKSFCEAREVLAKTDAVKNEDWQIYEFVFQPQSEVTHIVLHAYYLNPVALSYNGNILLDDASPIEEVNCAGQALLIQDEDLIELTPRSLLELESFIALHGDHIVFQRGGSELLEYRDAPLYDPDHWSRIYFSVIGRAMQRFPTHQLVIGVKGNSKKQVQQRISFIRQFLQQRGVEDTAFQCLDVESVKDDSNWITSNRYLAFRLAPKPASAPARSSR